MESCEHCFNLSIVQNSDGLECPTAVWCVVCVEARCAQYEKELAEVRTQIEQLKEECVYRKKNDKDLAGKVWQIVSRTMSTITETVNGAALQCREARKQFIEKKLTRITLNGKKMVVDRAEMSHTEFVYLFTQRQDVNTDGYEVWYHCDGVSEGATLLCGHTLVLANGMDIKVSLKVSDPLDRTEGMQIEIVAKSN